MTKVSYGRLFEKQIDKVPPYIRSKVREWVFAIEESGIAEVAKKPGLHDEPLKGQRLGQRSVRLNRAYRLIYEVIDDRVHIRLLEVHKHEY